MSDAGMNEHEPMGDQFQQEPPRISPGAQLAEFRRQRGWTVEQVAGQLNLAPRQIVAIEGDDYPSLPGMPIVRGFVRAYAKLLKVDAAPLLVTLTGETVFAQDPIAPRKTLSTPFAETALPLATERHALASKWVIGLLFVLLVAVAVWALGLVGDLTGMSKQAISQAKESLNQLSGSASPADVHEPKAALPSGEAPPVQAPAAPVHEVAAADGSSSEPDASGAVPTASQSTPSVQSELPAQPIVQAQTATTSGQPATTADTQPSPNNVVAAAPGKAVESATVNKAILSLKARQDSWVEIRRAGNNSVVLSRIVKAGETESFEVSEPVSVVIGNAAGVDATLRGTPLDLKTGGTNVARLSLK